MALVTPALRFPVTAAIVSLAPLFNLSFPPKTPTPQWSSMNPMSSTPLLGSSPTLSKDQKKTGRLAKEGIGAIAFLHYQIHTFL